LPGERLVLCSDALAEYFLTYKPWLNEVDFWQSMAVMNDTSFSAWTEKQKALGELKDDDYTFLMLQFPQIHSDKRVVKSAEAQNGDAAEVDKLESQLHATNTLSENTVNTLSDTSNIVEDTRKAASIQNFQTERDQAIVRNS
jgi:hypothetical protein